MQLTFTVLKKEGDLRFNLVRTRENSGIISKSLELADCLFAIFQTLTVQATHRASGMSGFENEV